MRNKIRKINFPLFIGVIIVIHLFMMSLYPQKFTSKDPQYEEKPKYVEVNVEGVKKDKLISNPMPPNKENILGTDDAGRDVYVRLVYGTKNTMKLALFIALLRMVIALPLGISAGMGCKSNSTIIRIFNILFTAIPMLIFSFIILNIGYFRSMQMDQSIIAFSIVLAMVGWAKLAGIIEDSTRLVMEEDFIEGEVAIGKTKAQIAFQNVIPHIVPTSVSLFFKEMGLALFLIAQLAVLYVFVGVTRQISGFAFRANYFMNLEPEWGGNLSRIAQNMKGFENTYWMVVFPALAFTIAIIGFNLVGEGLRLEFQKRDSRIISSIKKLTYVLSPKVFIGQLKNLRVYYKPVLLKVSAIALLIAYLVIPWNPSKYDFDMEGAKMHLKEFTSSEYEGRAPGTEGGQRAGDYIIEELKSYGYEVSVEEVPLKYNPIIDNENGSIRINSDELLVPMYIEEGWITITDENGEEKTFNLHEDFTIITISESIYQNSGVKELNYKGVAVDEGRVKDVDEDREIFPIERSINHFFSFGTGASNMVNVGQGKSRIFDVAFMSAEDYSAQHNAGLYKYTTIIPFGELAKELEQGYLDMEINFDYPKAVEYSGRNITAILPGKDKTVEKPGRSVVIGASYDGVYSKNSDNPYAMTATPASVALSLAKTISELDEPLNKSVQFNFWDNDHDLLKYGHKDGSYYYSIEDGKAVDMAFNNGYYYLDISYPGFKEDKSLNVITYPAEMADSSNYLMGMEIQERLTQLNIDFKRFFYDYVTTKGVSNMHLNALSTAGFGNPSTWGINTSIDTLENINYERMEAIGQIVLDTLTMNKYMLQLE